MLPHTDRILTNTFGHGVQYRLFHLWIRLGQILFYLRHHVHTIDLPCIRSVLDSAVDLSLEVFQNAVGSFELVLRLAIHEQPACGYVLREKPSVAGESDRVGQPFFEHAQFVRGPRSGSHAFV